MTTINNIEHTRQDTYKESYVFNEPPTPSLTGSTIQMTIKREKENDDTIILQDDATVTNPTIGAFTFNFTKEEMDIEVGDYYYDIVRIDSTGVRTTLEKGLFQITFNTNY